MIKYIYLSIYLENCNYVIQLGRKFGFSLVGVGGSDLYEGKQIMTLSLLWQLMRLYTLSILTELALSLAKLDQVNDPIRSIVEPIEEILIIEWANRKLIEANKIHLISDQFGFSDLNLKTGLAVIDLIDAIRPGTVDYSLVYSGQNEQVSFNIYLKFYYKFNVMGLKLE